MQRLVGLGWVMDDGGCLGSVAVAVAKSRKESCFMVLPRVQRKVVLWCCQECH